MKASLALEAIGYEAAHRMRKGGILPYNDPRKWAAKTLARNGGKLPQPWVAEIIDGYERRFLRHTKDFEQANGSGNRGVRLFFILESGKLYQVQELTSWTNKRRYFCLVTDTGDIQELSEEEAHQWGSVQTEKRVWASPSTMQPPRALSASLQTFLASMSRSAAAKTPR